MSRPPKTDHASRAYALAAMCVVVTCVALAFATDAAYTIAGMAFGVAAVMLLSSALSAAAEKNEPPVPTPYKPSLDEDLLDQALARIAERHDGAEKDAAPDTTATNAAPAPPTVPAPTKPMSGGPRRATIVLGPEALANSSGMAEAPVDVSPRSEERDDPHETSTTGAIEAQDTAVDESTGVDTSQTTSEEAAQDDQEARSQLDQTDLLGRLIASQDPIEELKLFVGDVRTREARVRDERTSSLAATGTLPTPGTTLTLAPSPFERYVARRLEEAGLFEKEPALPRLKVVQLHTSSMIYLRIEDRQCTYGAYLRVLRIEAALNAMRFASVYYDDPNDETVESLYRMSQHVTGSVAAQAGRLLPAIFRLTDDEDTAMRGEWHLRRGLAAAIECLQVPYRLEASFRTNVSWGNAAIELTYTPPEVFPASFFVEGLGVVASSSEMRRKAASSYALRLALLVAACAFGLSRRLGHVWVAVVQDTGKRRTCYLSVDFDRARFARVDLASTRDLARVYRAFAPVMRLENDMLEPVAQSFSLEEERFCPAWRYDAVSLSTRRIDEPYATALGCDRVCGLGIDEAEKRRAIASDISRRIVGPEREGSTLANVRAILEAAGDDPDPTVREAAERCAGKIVEGTLAEEPFAVEDEFVSGDALTQALDYASRLQGRRQPREALKVLDATLAPLDERGIYQDSPTVVWRCFDSYVDRVFYNRLLDDGRTVMLVPDAYVGALRLRATAHAMLGDAKAALADAYRVTEMAPLDVSASLQTAYLLEQEGDLDGACDVMRAFLRLAHDPESISHAYHHMAHLQWEAGHALAAQACYQRSLQVMPSASPLMLLEMTTLMLQSPEIASEELSPTRVAQVLGAHDIPLAPTDDVSELFVDAMRASVDCEVFPVAREFVSTMALFSRDDIVYAILNSLENEPDR